MYMSYLSQIIEYTSVVWDGCSEQDSVTLQKIQNEAARLVKGLTRSVFFDFSLTVKAAPYECVIRTGQP